MMKNYIKEIVHLKIYVISLILIIGCSYSVYIVFDPETVAYLGEEDHFFEWWTAISLFLASAVYLYLSSKMRSIWFLLLSLLLFFGAGEELSWGQRIIGFDTPEAMARINIQGVVNIHNIEMFDRGDFKGNPKTGFSRLLELHLLFRLFMIFYGIILPLLAYHVMPIQRLTERARLPVPPIAIGILFFINWFIFWLLHTYVLTSQFGFQYIDTAGEIFECMAALIFLGIGIYFHINRKTIIMGKDIKNYLQ